MSSAGSRTQTQTQSQTVQFRPTLSFSNITNDPRINRLSKRSMSKLSSSNSTASLLQSTIETRKYLQNLSILDIHAQTQSVKKYKPLDLSRFLIEQTNVISDNGIPLPTTSHMEVQCDAITPRPVTPLKVRGKTGLDMAVQVDSSELFDFDRDVQPLLDVVVDKTVDQALTEVRNEHVLQTLQQHHQALVEVADAEKQRVHSMQQKERQRLEAKELLLEHRLLQQQKENALKQKALSIRMAGSFLNNLMEDTLSNLEQLSIFRNPVLKDIESHFLPQIKANAQQKLDFFRSINRIVDDIIKNTALQITNEAARNARIVGQQQEMRDVIHLYVNVQATNQKIGPLNLTRFDHVHDIDAVIREWYQKEKGDSMENATITLTFNGAKITTECLGNLDLHKGVIEMDITRKPDTEQDDEDQDQDDTE